MTTPPIDPSVLGSLDLGGKTKTKFGAVDLSKSTYNIAGLGLKPNVTGGKSVLNSEEFARALHQTAITDPKTWAGIQYAMYRANYYGSATPDIGVWGKSDLTGIKGLMEAMTVLQENPQNLQASSFLTSQENAAISLGGNGVRNQIAKVKVPNTLDLNYISDKAFRMALGRPPTAKESKRFATSYQSDVMAIARDNAAAVSSQRSQAKTPNAAVSSQSPQAGTPNAAVTSNSIDQNLSTAQLTPTTSVVGTQDIPQVDVAATDFARKSAPAEAGAQNVSNALDAMFSSLARNSH